ncbi:MAG TPA: ABC transporter substrate-binding protein [Streptosporangiaceae bacterium]|nr:ABC transporter substrate-binding protein [Streptosporangiaceae bacterium]
MRPNSEEPGRGGAGRPIHRRTRFATLIAALAAAALLAAGCGSSGSSGGNSPSAAATSPAATSSAAATQAASPAGTAPADDIGITASTIKVGMIADVNNSLVPGLFQKSVNAVKAWADIVNASGGLAGRKVVVDFCDSQLNPNATTNCVIKACQNDFALVGTSANALEDLSDLDGCKNAEGKAIGIANLTAFAFPPLTCDPVTYLASGLGPYCKTAKANPQTYTVPVGDTQYFLAHNQNLHGIWLYDSDDATFKITQTPLFQAESNLGIKKDGQGFYALSGAAAQSALTPFIQQIKASGSTFVYDDVTTASMVLVRREAQLQGVNSVKVWLCNSGCYDPNFYKQGGAAVNGTYASLVPLPYLTDYKVNPTLGKLVTQLGGVDNLDNNGLNSFVMALLFQDAVNKAIANGGTLNRQTLFTALNDEHSFDADGIIGPTDIGNRVASACSVLVQLQNGAWQRVDPVKPGTFDCNKDNLTTINLNTGS